MTEVTNLAKEWGDKLAQILTRPPYLAVACRDGERARTFLKELFEGISLGMDLTHPKMDYTLAVPFEVTFSSWEELQNALLSLELVVVLGDSNLEGEVKGHWKVKTLMGPEGDRADEVFAGEVYSKLPFVEGTAFAMKSPSREVKREAALEYASLTAFRAAFIGALPFPLADLFVLTPLQIGGVLKIASIYNHSFNKDRAKELIGVLGGRMLFRAAGRNIAKLVPGLGSVVGAGVAFGGTYAILKTAQVYFERGASLNPKEREHLKKVYLEAEKEGKDLFSSDQMKEFRKLQLKHQSGAISKEEFEKRLKELERK